MLTGLYLYTFCRFCVLCLTASEALFVIEIGSLHLVCLLLISTRFHCNVFEHQPALVVCIGNTDSFCYVGYLLQFSFYGFDIMLSNNRITVCRLHRVVV